MLENFKKFRIKNSKVIYGGSQSQNSATQQAEQSRTQAQIYQIHQDTNTKI